MAVALATLPSNSRLAGGGDTFFTTATGAGLPDDFAADFDGAFAGLTGFAAGIFLVAAFAAGFAAALGWLRPGAAFFATGLPAGDLLAVTFFTTAAFFGAATFFGVTAFFGAATFLGTAFFTADFFATGFFAGLAFLPCGFTTVLEAAGFVFDFAAVTGLTGAFFDTGLATVRPAFAGVLLTFFTTFPFAAVVFDAAALTPFALFEALFFCALALELPVVFAISLHRGWPWRPGVIAHVSFTSKPDSGILVTLHPL